MNGKKEQQWEFFSAIPSPGNATKIDNEDSSDEIERMKKKMFGLTFHENIVNPFPSPSALFPAISTFLSLFSFASAQYYKTIYIRNSRL